MPAPPASSVTVTAGQRAQAGRCPANVHAKSHLILETSADTPVRKQGPGRSLPGPDAGHPLHATGDHEAVSMIRNTRGMILTLRGTSDPVRARKSHNSPVRGRRDRGRRRCQGGRTTPSARSQRRAARAALFIQTSAPVGLTPLGQFEIFERGRIAERNQDGAANLRRVGTVRSVRLDIPLRAWWI